MQVTKIIPALLGTALCISAIYPTIFDDHTILYEWLEANLDAFEAKIPSNEHQELPLTMTGVCNEKNLALLRDFFTDRDEKYAVSFDKQVESVITCIARRERDNAALMEFLAQYDDGAAKKQ